MEDIKIRSSHVTSISRSLLPLLYHIGRDCSSAWSLSYCCHEIYEHSREIHVPSVLTRRVIVGEGVVVIVKPLPHGTEGHANVLGGVNPLVVRFISVQVSEAVDAPRGVESAAVPEEWRQEERVPGTLAPTPVRDDGRDNETHHYHERFVDPERRRKLNFTNY